MMNSVGPVMALQKARNAMALHCTEKLQSGEARTLAVNTAVCPANHLAITLLKKSILCNFNSAECNFNNSN